MPLFAGGLEAFSEVSNDRVVFQLVKRIKKLAPERIVLEATRGVVPPKPRPARTHPPHICVRSTGHPPRRRPKQPRPALFARSPCPACRTSQRIGSRKFWIAWATASSNISEPLIIVWAESPNRSSGTRSVKSK